MNPYYKDYSEYLAGIWPGIKVQKLSIDAGFTCPNRDGTIATGGCIYCDNRSFTPRYCNPADTVSEQLRKGKEFFSRKYPEMKYLAYFQSFTGTHASAPDILERMYDEAVADPAIVGVIIGTRPDCLSEKTMNLLARLNEKTRVFVEIGAETSFDVTLQLINRRHTWQDVIDAVTALDAVGIDTGLHLIAGLPGEDESMILETVRNACRLPLKSIKMHQLQIIRNTRLHKMIERKEITVTPFEADEYLDLCARIVETVTAEAGRRIAIERFVAQAPPEMVVAPKWGLKNYEFTNLLHKRLRESTSLNKIMPINLS